MILKKESRGVMMISNRFLLCGIPLITCIYTHNAAAIMHLTHAAQLHKLDYQLKTTVAQLALNAYDCALHRGIKNNKHILTIIDYSIPSIEKRLWVINVAKNRILYKTYVTHGSRSGDHVYTKRFSDKMDSHQSSLGLFLTKNTYVGHQGYSLNLHGLERGYNDLAEARRIVIHGASYATADYVKTYKSLGRSWGCPAVSQVIAKPLINTIKEGTLVFSYYPEKNWLKHSSYLHCQV